MGDEDKPRPRRRDNRVYGSIWVDSDGANGPNLRWWMWVAPLAIGAIMLVGCFGLQFLGWDGTPGVGP